MDELIKTVTEKAGINEDQAKAAVEAVIAQLKDKLPGPIACQVESVLGGGNGDGGAAGGLMGAAKGMLGR